jgi:hypothetical protein
VNRLPKNDVNVGPGCGTVSTPEDRDGSPLPSTSRKLLEKNGLHVRPIIFPQKTHICSFRHEDWTVFGARPE